MDYRGPCWRLKEQAGIVAETKEVVVVGVGRRKEERDVRIIYLLGLISDQPLGIRLRPWMTRTVLKD